MINLQKIRWTCHDSNLMNQLLSKMLLNQLTRVIKATCYMCCMCVSGSMFKSIDHYSTLQPWINVQINEICDCVECSFNVLIVLRHTCCMCCMCVSKQLAESATKGNQSNMLYVLIKIITLDMCCMCVSWSICRRLDEHAMTATWWISYWVRCYWIS